MYSQLMNLNVNKVMGGIYITEEMVRQFYDQVGRKGREGCWLWLGTPTPDGYGRFKISGSENIKMLAHRFAYLLFVGEIDKPTLDHLCHNEDPGCPGGKECKHRLCCRPDHLKPATRGENTNASPRGNASKTHCPEGHPYDELDGNGHRCCRRCRLAKRKAAHARRRAAKGLPVYAHPGAPSPKNVVDPAMIR